MHIPPHCILTPGPRFAIDGGDVFRLIVQPVPCVVRPVGYVINQHCNGVEWDPINVCTPI